MLVGLGAAGAFVHAQLLRAELGHASAELDLVFLAILGGLAAAMLIAAHSYYRYVTGPIRELTRLADEVSTGNLEVRFDAGVDVRCWEIKDCRRDDCVAYGNTELQCWFVDGTPCEGYDPNFPEKLVGCRSCEVYQAHRGDEIVQLTDSFRHMTRVLHEHQQELERSAEFQRSLIHNSFDGIIATDDTNVVRVFNRVAQNLSGYREDEVVGRRTWMGLFDPDVARQLHHPVLEDGAGVVFGFYRKETALLAHDGKRVDVLASGITMREQGRQVGMVFFFKDMREIMKLRRELVRSERLAAAGQTVASISHGVKNILDGLRGGAYIYKRGLRIEDPEVRTQGWEMVERNIDHISELVADLLNFAKERVPQREECDPSVLVQDVLFTLQPKADAQGTTLAAQLDPSTAPFDLDAHSMMQLLANLVSNALDATREVEGGRVSIRTALTEDDRLEIVVEDNGPGVAPEIRDELFSSLVSTKGSKGTGLGLMVVEKITAEHGGTVACLSESTAGAVFRVRIPRQDALSTRRSPFSEARSARVIESK